MRFPARYAFLVRPARLVGGFLLLLGLLLFGAYGYVHGGGNYHEVEKGVLYRSSRLSTEKLEHLVIAEGVKTILNLCGEQPGVAWYEGEKSCAQRQGVKFISLGLSANTPLDAKQLASLVAILRDAPKPLLVHCRAGSDRTGLVCALFVASQGGSYRDANNQLSLYYGHFPYLGGKSVAMDVSLRRFFDTVANRRVVSQAEAR